MSWSLPKISFNKSPQKIEGEIGYYSLEDWWLSNFTEGERRRIEEVFQPMGLEGKNILTRGKIYSSSQTVTMFLVILAGWFKNPRDRQLANRIIEKAEKMGSRNQSDILGNHFLYSEMISIYYPQREKEGMLEEVVSACKKQIELAPSAARAFVKKYPGQPLPSHRGYKQLVIILDKQGNFEEAIRLCEQAKAQGWVGNWGKRVARYQKKLRSRAVRSSRSV